MKWIEVSILVLAGAAFVWWQLRDVRQAQEQSRKQRLAAEVPPETASPTAPPTADKEPRP